MAKVSIVLRGWRFDEAEVFDDDGSVRPLEEMEPDTRQRIVRLLSYVDEPCDCCYLIHGDADIEQCNPAQAIYGEPLGEVVLCNDHEADFVYWFQKAGGRQLAGERELQNAFYAWFDDGNRAPESFSLEHVDEDPDAVPDPPDPEEAMPGIEDELDEMDDEELEAMDVDLSDIDVGEE